jgi:hypothetical protein
VTKRAIKAALLELAAREVTHRWQGDVAFGIGVATKAKTEAHRGRVDTLARELADQLTDKAERLRANEAAYQERRKR